MVRSRRISFSKKPALASLAIFLCLLLFASVPIETIAAHKDGEVEDSLSEENLVSLIKPSIVRLGQHVVGEIEIANPRINLLDLTMTPPTENNRVKIDVDVYMTGSGFFVNTDGYIVTNAHVVSQESVKAQKLDSIIKNGILRELFSYTADDEIEKLSSYDEKTFQEFFDKIYEYVRAESIFNLEYHTVVIDPEGKDENLKEAIDNGIPVNVVYANDNYFSDRKDFDDIALVRVRKKDTPAIHVASSSDMVVGMRIYTIGFPANASIDSRDFLESTFTSGVIGGKKKIEDASVWQIDAKVSGGSSGGPMVNRNGEVVGVVSFMSGDSSEGDNFAFAIPLSAIEGALEKAKIQNKEGEFGSLFRDAIALKEQKHCGRATETLRAAAASSDFIDLNVYTQPYIDQCAALIESGISIDTVWDEFMEWLGGIDLVIWLVILGGVATVIVFIVVIFFLRKKVSKEESDFEKLEDFVIKEHYQKEFTGGTDKTIDPSMVQYIKESRAMNVADSVIEEELRRVGWPVEDVREALE